MILSFSIVAVLISAFSNAEPTKHNCPAKRCPGKLTAEKYIQGTTAWSVVYCDPFDKTKRYHSNRLAYPYFDQGQINPKNWAYPQDPKAVNCKFDLSVVTDEEIKAEKARLPKLPM